ncbi:MAG: hypothetical protein ACE5H9_01265 [Anaerolineae bacterium]
MRKLIVVGPVVVLLVLGLGIALVQAQEPEPEPVPVVPADPGGGGGGAGSGPAGPVREAKEAVPLGPTEVGGGPGGTAEAGSPAPLAAATCDRQLTVDVVALDQPFFYNRLGAFNPAGMIYALRRDVVNKNTGLTEAEGGTLAAGQVMLREDKRPRPLTLRMNVGDCLQINFQNLLAPVRLNVNQPATRLASLHVNGLQLVNSILDDGSNVGQNPSSLVAPGDSRTYTLYAEHENTYLIYSLGATTGAEGNGGSAAFGLFGAVNVEPRGAEWYRSQATRDEMDLATTGTTADGHPLINYDATYPAGTGGGKDGLPILKILDGNEIVHSDLNAIITGPGRGKFPDGTYPPNATLAPDRNQPFREFTVIFHDEIFAVQAFDIFEDPDFEFALHSVRDGFAINYGTGGIGAEMVANRIGVGPMWNCTDCLYEESFLTSWAVGDPAMVVDIPANSDLDGDGQPDPGSKATKVLYPDDPSNVHHAYLNDRVVFRNLHGGPKEHHIFHLHAHQWLSTPDDPNSSYLDSQAIGPGSAYSYEIAYGGAGNRNKTAGDSIFHCHFYPHFAQGMWELWRVHDTFEWGTELDADGRPVAGARALPDGEIPAGTPIPALVPVPGQAMAPMPGDVHVEARDVDGDGLPDSSQVVVDEPDGDGDGIPDRSPGYPFYIPGESGHRPPTPPLDLVDDGGLRRHVLVDGDTYHVESPLNFEKEVESIEVKYLPEDGTPEEKSAMAFHEQQFHASYKPDGSAASFETNGLARVAGAPYADPCRDDGGGPLVGVQYGTNNPRVYKAADIQMDVTLNKVGWHFPQQRFLTLWEDVGPTLNKDRPPQPLVMRLNTNDCATFYHTNLVPNVYELDDFQVRTPTDVIGQHIHLVKFDVTSSDGSANGFNYEDGTLSPDEVRVRIRAIRKENACLGDEFPNNGNDDPNDGTDLCPVARAHPFFGPGPDNRWMGARTSVQRWFADPLLSRSLDNAKGKAHWDRSLGTVFTHDHFSPSTHQQAGLYATVLIEPDNSVWRDPETGVTMGTRTDGGPTSWRADILTEDPANSHREFYLEFADFQPAYEAGRGIDDYGNPVPDFQGAINPPSRGDPPDPADIFWFPPVCENGQPRPCPEAIAADDPGTYVVNYRNEPLGLRVFDPVAGGQAAGKAGDLSFAFSSDVTRAIPELNTQPGVYPPLTDGVEGGDPFTPLLRTYSGDKVRIRAQVGAQEEEHTLTMHGLRWLQEPYNSNSGWRNSQFMGLSEYFSLDMEIVPAPQQEGNTADYLWTMGAQVDDYWNGTWGLLRAYASQRGDLLPLPNNPITAQGLTILNEYDFRGICPANAPVRYFDITAVTAQDVLPGGTLVYNSRTSNNGPLHDPTALLYVLTSDLDLDPVTGAVLGLKPGVPVEPLILRANAGDCLEITLRNMLPEVVPDLAGFNSVPPIVHKDKNANGGVVTFNANDIRPSSQVGLHTQLLSYDITRSDGANVGLNNHEQTVEPGHDEEEFYTWYAGIVSIERTAAPNQVNLVATPVEFGAVNLMPSDRIKHSNKGLVGALIIEPQGATWAIDPGTRASATVTKTDGSWFREFVTVWQDDINMRFGDGSPVPNIAGEGPGVPEDPQDSGQKAINYRTEPLWFRLGIAPNTPFGDIGNLPVENVFSNAQIGGQDPQTPVFTAYAGIPARLRLLQPAGHARGHVFTLNGHSWPRHPYINDSTEIGDNPLSAWHSSREGFNPSSHFDVVLDSAGGKYEVLGDYLFRDQAAFGGFQGLWGLLRVAPLPDLQVTKDDGGVTIQPGDTVTYTITFANVGGANATGVVLTETVPANTTFNAGASTPGWVCLPDGNAGSICTLAIGLVTGNGGGGQVDFALDVDNPIGAGIETITNTVEIGDDTTHGPDRNPDDNYDNDITPVYAEPDLQITKDDGGVTVQPGDTVTYTITFTNTGSQNASGVVLTETVPAGTTFNAGASTPGWVCLPDGNAGSICTLAIGLVTGNGGGGQVDFALDVDNPIGAGIETITNTVEIDDDGRGGPDRNDDDNYYDDITPVYAEPDLQVSKDDGGVIIRPGDTVTYTITFTNTGNQSASGVVLTETVPANTTFNAGASTPGWVCLPDGNAGSICTLAIGTVTGNGGGGQVDFAVDMDIPIEPGIKTITNTVEIADDGRGGSDPNPNDNTDDDITPVDGKPDLQVSKDDGGVIIQPGDTVTYTITFTNVGGVNASGVVLTETVPAGTTFNAGASTPGWVCLPDGNAGSICTLAIGPVSGAGGGGQVDFAVDVDNPIGAGIETINNTVLIADDGRGGPDRNADDNNNADITPVDAEPDLQVSKDDGGVTVLPGDTVTYTITFTNTGSQNASGVVLTETVPANTTFNAGASTPGWVCVPDGNAGSICTLAIGTVSGAGSGGQVDFAVDVDKPLAVGVTQVDNIVKIDDDGRGGPDRNPDDNNDADITPVDNRGAITIVKETDEAKAFTTFNFILNDGTGNTPLTLQAGQSKMFPNLVSGRYTVSETLSGGWALLSVVCTNGTELQMVNPPQVAIDLKPGEEVTCVFNNGRITSEPEEHYLYLPLIFR